MERAGRVVSKLRLASCGVTEEQMATAAWSVAVGNTIARRTSVIALVRTRLVIAVEDKVWQRQLFTLRGQILTRLDEALGKKLVEELEFRISVAPRKPVQTAETPMTSADEADGIRDPVLRGIYKSARRKAIG